MEALIICSKSKIYAGSNVGHRLWKADYKNTTSEIPIRYLFLKKIKVGQRTLQKLLGYFVFVVSRLSAQN